MTTRSSLAMAQAYTFDPALHVLGKPCKRRHLHEDTGLCLRYLKQGNKKTGRCVACRSELSASLYQKNRNAILERQKGKPRKRRSMTAKCQARLEEWKRLHPDRERERNRKRSRLKEANRRARQRQVHQWPVSQQQLKHRFSAFGNSCAYCGSEQHQSLDHFIPIASGGPHALGNFLPACIDCNSCKRDLDPEAWYRVQPFFTEQRWRKILRILGKQRVPVGQLSLM